MLFRQIFFGVLIRAARNPAVQKKAGDVASKAFKRARPSLLRASRKTGELMRNAKQKLSNHKNLD